MKEHFTVRPIGWVESPLVELDSVPRQPDEGAPAAWLAFDSSVSAGLNDVEPGDEILVLTWLHRSRRDVLEVHPRDDMNRPPTGVFSTRSADRPNPIGLHRVEVIAVDGRRVQVGGLDALDGTPILDVKPSLSRDIGSR